MLARELKRGSTELLILALLEERDRHGYELARLIDERSRGAISFHAASLYPTLYRMEDKDLIEGRWVEKAGQRRRRYYRLTAAGRKTLASQRSVWDNFFEALNRVARITPRLRHVGSWSASWTGKPASAPHSHAPPPRPTTTSIEELAQHARARCTTPARADGCSHDEADARVSSCIDAVAAPTPRAAPQSRARRDRRRTAIGGVIGLAGAGCRTSAMPCGCCGGSRGFALLAVLTMALGIGATTALFSVTYGVLMKPLPWPIADRLVVLKETRGGNAPRFGSFSNAAYLAWREQPRRSRSIAAWVAADVHARRAPAIPSAFASTAATASLFRVLGVRPLLGSLFDEQGRSRAGRRACRKALWRQRFGADPRRPRPHRALRRRSRTRIVGVLPDALAYPGSAVARVGAVPRPAAGRQPAVDVRRARQAATRRDSRAGRRRRHGARPLRRRHRHDDDGDLRQRRPDRNRRRAAARRADRATCAGR